MRLAYDMHPLHCQTVHAVDIRVYPAVLIKVTADESFLDQCYQDTVSVAWGKGLLAETGTGTATLSLHLVNDKWYATCITVDKPMLHRVVCSYVAIVIAHLRQKLNLCRRWQRGCSPPARHHSWQAGHKPQKNKTLLHNSLIPTQS